VDFPRAPAVPYSADPSLGEEPVRTAAALPLVVLLACAHGARAGEGANEIPAPLRLVARIALPGVRGRIDHMAVDGEGKRLFVAALGNDTVEVVDLVKRVWERSLEGVGKPTGVAWLPHAKRLAVASGRDGTLAFYDGDASLGREAVVAVGADADNVRVDANGETVWVGYGEGALGSVDGAMRKPVGSIALPGHPEAFALEHAGDRVFVNVPGERRVIVLDRRKGATVASWSLGAAASNFPMALDEARHRLYVGCRRPSRIVVLDTASGKAVADLDGPGDADDLFLDAKRGRLYASGGDGTVTVLQHGKGDAWQPLPPVETAPGARTSLWVESADALFVAAPRRGARAAEILVLEAVP
jgi:DNA-binding beta-propeller fold protein YncE